MNFIAVSSDASPPPLPPSLPPTDDLFPTDLPPSPPTTEVNLRMCVYSCILKSYWVSYWGHYNYDDGVCFFRKMLKGWEGGRKRGLAPKRSAVLHERWEEHDRRQNREFSITRAYLVAMATVVLYNLSFNTWLTLGIEVRVDFFVPLSIGDSYIII